MNASLTPIANFQRDGAATFVSQGARPNYQNTIQPLTYVARPGAIDSSARNTKRNLHHENWIGAAWRDLSEVTKRKCAGGRGVIVWCADGTG